MMSSRSPARGSRGQSPAVTRQEAARLCERYFFRPARVDVVDGYEGANFRVEDRVGRCFVLKLCGEGTQAQAIRLEQAVLKRLVAEDWPGVPRLVSSRRGRLLERVEQGEGPSEAGGALDVRMLTWIDGVVMAAVDSRSPTLLSELGFYLGSLDLSLAVMDPGEERVLAWDLAWLHTNRSLVELIAETEDRALVEAAIDTFIECREVLAPLVPRGLIHNDANDHNVIVSSAQGATASLVGLIDFGDLTVTETVYELAIAAAYVGFDQDDPWRAAWPLIAGYNEARPLRTAELELLFPAVQARLALTVLMAAKRRHQGTADRYALVSERGGWAALRRLQSLSVGEALEALRSELEAGRGRGLSS